MSLFETPGNPAPAGAVVASLTTADRVMLRAARWPALGERKGTVCIFQDRGEFIEKYFEAVGDLRRRGFAVATLDWRGQGLSGRASGDRRKGHVRNFSEYTRDLDVFMRELVLPDCPPPYFALGHSMGAIVLIEAAARDTRRFERTVLTAPMIALAHVPLFGHAPRVARLLRYAGMGAAYAPGGGRTALLELPFGRNVLTSDPVRFARVSEVLASAPQLGVGSPTVAWTDAMFRAMKRLGDPAFASRLRQPMLILAGGRDVFISAEAIESFAIHLRAGSQFVIPGAMHDLLLEQDHYREQFWAAFDAFVPGTPLFR